MTRYNTKNSIFNNLVTIIVFFTGIISSCIIIFSYKEPGYNLLFLMPIIYVICFVKILNRTIFHSKSIFVASLSVVSYLRYVILPFLICLSGLYGGRSYIPPTNSSYRKAILIMIYEIICVSITIYYIYNKEIITSSFSINKFKFKFVYLSFFIVTFLLTIIFPTALAFFSFVSSSMSGASYLLSPSSIESIVIYFLYTSKLFIYVFLQVYLAKKFYKTKSLFYKVVSYFLLVLNLCIFYGMNRMDLIIPTIASVVFEVELFKEKSYKKYIFVGILLVIIISGITSSRDIASYSLCYFGEKNTLVDLTDMFQGYLGGPYNVAISIETVSYFPESRNLLRLLYDTFRPMIGINIILKNIDMTLTNAFFNRRIWLQDFSSQIMPMVGQGFIHLGYIFAPLLSCLVVILASKIEKISYKSDNPIVRYVTLICIIRCGMLMGQSTSNIINELSMNLLLSSLLIWLSNRITIRELKEK